jgi:hypothetical protein
MCTKLSFSVKKKNSNNIPDHKLSGEVKYGNPISNCLSYKIYLVCYNVIKRIIIV